MKSQPRPRASNTHKRFLFLATVPLLFTLILFSAQQASAQYGQYPQPQYAQPQYTQPNPYAGQYAPNQQPGYAQPGYSQPYAPQQYPAPTQQYAPAPPNQAYDQSQGSPLDLDQSQPAPQPLTPDQLEQLVAPLALYPDALVAQVLAAATYPAQVVGADHWLQAQGYASPDQIAYGADSQSWDPSVKALTAFPQVLAQMDRDLQWTTDLGNAYYNQPQDVLQTVQVLRQRAQAAGNLQNTPQEAVSYNQGYIQLAPVDPQVVYVPAYNPWDVYGQPIQPYSGFSLLGSLESFAGSGPVRFGLGMAMSAFSHTPFGWATWALNWLTQSVLFHQSNYTSHSTSVAQWNYPRNGLPSRTPRGFDAYSRTGNYARPATEFARSGGYNAYNRQPAQSFTRQQNYPDNRPYSAYRGNDENRAFAAPNREYQQPGNFVRPAIQDRYAYNRAQPVMPARPQPYDRLGNGFNGRQSQTYAPQQRNDFSQRSQFGSRSYPTGRSYSAYGSTAYGNREFAESRPEKSGGFHLFGNHNSEKSYGSYKAPRSYGGGRSFKEPKEHSHGSSHSGGGGHHGGHHF
jgi:hypothetical protein